MTERGGVGTRARGVLERGGLVDITTVGRRSGEPRRIEIALHNVGGRLFISGMPSPRRRSWLANVEAKPRFILHLREDGGLNLSARARIVDTEHERREVLRAIARAWGRDDLEEMVRHSPLIEVLIDRAGEPGT